MDKPPDLEPFLYWFSHLNPGRLIYILHFRFLETEDSVVFNDTAKTIIFDLRPLSSQCYSRRLGCSKKGSETAFLGCAVS